ncbi:MAG: TlyA family RNA methyltransferase [Tessaracoccus sp.]|uniref:TlyA family RNA methyltransferase n=1 Tax=Tessaracoccus sp. TaxID=1971211 RepID=UPI001EC0780E|nr:TlyA family RNA methyltransferase [Tessaracoccus sp.]MBK7821468.1 TlyA family RNA methyltransferase [Tessaracoccus sp.]
MRLDVALVARGLARSRTQAARLLAEGRVTLNGATAAKPSTPVTGADDIAAVEERWVSRAAHKLLGALDDSGITVGGRVLDAGASTGGFTQVCLDRGASRVYAVDVGHGQLAAPLAADHRVVVHEGLNLRDLTLDHLEGAPVDLIVGDVSFISLTLLLPRLVDVLPPSGEALLLVKPQFEVGRDRLGAGGLVRDPALRAQAVDGVVAAARALGWRERWRGESRLPGASGNVEYFVHFVRA